MSPSPNTQPEDKLKLYNDYLKSKEELAKRDPPQESSDHSSMYKKLEDLKGRLNLLKSQK
jgi:hypothetical protein